MCSDLITNPREANKKVVTVQYVSPTVGLLGNGWKLVELRPGTATTPVVAITVDNEPQPRARFAFKSIATKPIVNISSTGTDLKVDSLIGVDTLIVSLVGTTIDDETALSAQDTLIVIALPTLTSVPLTATLNAIGATSDLLVSLQDNATPTPNLLRGRVWWKSTDPAVVSVDSAGARISTGLDAGKYGTTMTAVANGTAQILTIVEGRDTARTTVNVAQALSRYTFAVTTTAGVVTQPTISAVGDTLRVVARALDAKGVLLAPQPAFTLVSDVPAALSVHPDLGWAVGLATDTVNVRVAGRQSVDANEFIAIEILPKATNIRFPALVGGQVLMTAPNTDTTLTAIASDSRNVDINLANDRFTWTSSVQRVAQVGSDGKISARDTGTTVISASRDGRTVGFPVIVTNVPTTLSITPDPMPIRSLTETVQATTVARNTANGLVPNAVVNWTALDPTIATVNATGVVTGVAVGTARVVGVTEVGSATDTITVNVSNQPTSIVLGLASATLASINDTLVVSVTAKNGLGATLPATAVRWRSDASDVVKVSIANDGTIIALKRGDARIIAENADASVADTVAITVTNAPATVVLNRTNDTLTALTLTRQYAATIFNARGGVIVQGGGADQNQLTWRSTDQNVAQIDALSGLATATGNGTALIIGETGSGSFATGLRADTAILVVSNGAVAAAVNPSSASITSVGNTQQLVASATNNVGGPVTGLPFTWGTSDAAVATVSSTGLVTATGTGTATITATSGSLSATSTITVTNLPTSIDITLPNITFASVNDFSTLAATLTNAAGATLPSTAATWTSDDPLIALVTSDGTVTAKAPGSTKVRAVNPSNAAIRDSIIVTVSNAAATVTLTPGTAQTLTSLGQTLNLSTTVLNQAGQPISNPTVTWDLVSGTSISVSASGVGTGLVTALTNGAAKVRATSGAVSDTVDVIVAQAISPSQSTVSASPSSRVADNIQTSTVTVQLRDANGNNYVRAPAAVVVMTPSSGIPLTVTDNGNGNFTATHPAQTTAGTSTVTVTADGTSLSNSAIITFTPNTASQYVVSTSNATPVAGSSVTITAQLKDANGNNVATSGKTVTWSSSNGGSFGAATSLTNASGLATVTFTTATTTTTHAVTATDNTAVTGTSGAIATTPGAPSKYLVSSSAASVAAGGSVTITAQLADLNNNFVGTAGHVVTWTGGAGGSFGSASSPTNSSGVATVTFTPSTAAGTAVTVTGTDGDLRAGTSGTITTVAGAASKLTLTTSPEATPQSGIAFSPQPIVQLRDGSASQNPVSQANVSVTATISSGTGTLGGITTVLTDANGGATFSGLSISGAAGANTISFTSSGLTPISAGVTITPGAATQISLNAGNGQSATVNTAVGTAPSVLVRDAGGNPVSGVSVTFTVSGGSGQINDGVSGFVAGPLSVTTNGSGIAALTGWRLGTAAGANTLSATSGALSGSPVVFSATGTADAASSIVVSGTPSTSSTVGTSVSTPPAVLVRDQFNNPVSSAQVTFTLTAAGGTGGSIAPGSPAIVSTAANGIATLAAWTLGQTAGTDNNTVTATTAGVGTTLTFNASGTAGAAQNMIANSVISQSVTAGGLATPPSVIVRDAFNNPKGGVVVTFTVTAGGGSTNPASGNTVTSDATTGVATLTTWTTGTTAGMNTVTAGVAGLTGSPVTFNATGVAGVATAGQSTVVRTGANNIVADGVSSSTILVTARDANNNVVAGKTISLDDAGASSTISPASGTSDSNGQVTFTVTNTVGETPTYTATIADGGAVVVAQTAQVTFRAGTHYLVTAANSTPSAGSVVLITAQLRDGANQNVPQSGKTIVWSKLCNAIACAGGAAGGSFATPTSLTDATGKATVALTVSNDASIDMTVTATDNEALTGTSGAINVGPGAAAAVRVETAADGSGSVVGAQSVASGSSITVFAITRDGSGNFVANVAADAWTLINKTGGVVNGDLVVAGDNMSATFTGNIIGTAQIEATEAALAKTPSGVLTVTAGAAAAVRVETAADGSGAVVGAQNVSSGSSVTGFAITRDAAGNFVANVAADSWTLINKTGGVVNGDLVVVGGNMSATFTGALVGTAQIEATEGLLAKTPSGVLTVIPGAAAAVRVETAADGSGAVVGAQNVTSGSSVTGFAITRDAAGNFVANVAADSWTLINKTGGVVDGDLVVVGGNMSATFTGALVGTAQIEATEGLLAKTPSGVLTVVAGSPDHVTLAGPASVVAGATSTNFTVTVRDAAGNPSNVVGNTTFTVATNVSSGTATFSPVSPVQVDAGTSTVTFTYRNTVVGGGTHQISATRASGDALPGGAFANHNVTVTPDVATDVLIETAANGSGTVVGAQNVTSGSSVTGFAITRDQFGNFIANVAADSWTLINVTGGVVNGDLVVGGGSTSATFTGALVGTAQIEATEALLTKTPSGVLTVIAGAPDHVTLAGPASVVAGAASTDFTVTVRDAAGNPSNVVGNTTFTLATDVSSGTATFNPVSPVQVDAGSSSVAFTYTNTVVGGGTHQISATRASGDGLAGGTAANHSITVTPDALDHFVLVLASPQATAQAFTGTNTLTAKDQHGNTVTTFDASADFVTINLVNASTGTMSSNVLNLAGDFVNGVADLTAKGLTYTRSAAETTVDLQASSATTAKTSSIITITIGP